MGPERGRARPPGTMAGSDTAPFLSQADDPDDGPVPGNPGLPGSMGNPKSEEPEVPDQEGLQRITGLSPGHSALIVAVLCYINLLNYMDRFTVAGVLPDIEQFFNIGDSSSGLIQTVFISSYMVLAPVFGYLGDRYNRKYLMCGGIAFWSLVTLGSSFIPGEVRPRAGSCFCPHPLPVSLCRCSLEPWQTGPQGLLQFPWSMPFDTLPCLS